jgi:hypothetical protein
MPVALFAVGYARITRYLEKGVPLPEGQVLHNRMAGTSPDFATIYADALSASRVALTDNCTMTFIVTSCFVLMVPACVFCSPRGHTAAELKRWAVTHELEELDG